MAAYLASQGITIYGWQGMSQTEYQENLRLVRQAEARPTICVIGAES